MTTTDEVIAEITAAGFLVNNLFQCNTAQWQANLRNATGLTQFCIAATPAEALEGCLLLLNDLVPPRQSTAGFSIEARASLSDLINNQPTRNPINRRF